MISEPSSTLATIRINPHYLRAKRLFDIAFTLLASVLIIPIGLVVALLVFCDSGGPVVFRQKRVGLNGAEFDMFKFRSMHANSDDALHRQAIEKYMSGHVLNESKDTPYKLDNDDRITRVGRFIRRANLDELPQFWNVLRGEMTVVGPRPPLPYEVELYSPQARLRLCGKPGLTGPWQVYGRNRVPFQEMIEIDIAYLQRQSLCEDIKLIVLTVLVMAQGDGGI
jgi:lipopolysaccharide/colanic/teichoic acid biosynthesis glycosyltransferase